MSFQQAVARANQSKPSGKKLTNDQLLQLYGHYKVATVGANTTPQPSMLDIKGSAKWKAWKNASNQTRQQAEASYIKLVNSWL